MNFLEAAHSNKRFRQEGESSWYRIEDGKILDEKNIGRGFTVNQLMALNWEIEETMVRVCKTTYWAAVQQVFSDCVVGVDHTMPATRVLEKLTLLAVKLGVEDYNVGKA